jgi:hypothetical protein
LDGGVVERTGVAAWAEWAGASAALPARAIVHMVKSSVPQTANMDPAARNSTVAPPHARLAVISTPKSRANFFSLKDFDAQKDEAYGRAMRELYRNRVIDGLW